MQKSIYTFSISLLTILFLSTTINFSAHADNIISSVAKCDKCKKHGKENCTKKSCKDESKCTKDTKCSKDAKKDCKSKCKNGDKKTCAGKNGEEMKKQTGTAPDHAAPQK